MRRGVFVGEGICDSWCGLEVISHLGVVLPPVCPAFPLGFLDRAGRWGPAGQGPAAAGEAMVVK